MKQPVAASIRGASGSKNPNAAVHCASDQRERAAGDERLSARGALE